MNPDHDIDSTGEYEYPPRLWQPEWVRPERGPAANVVFIGDTSGLEPVAKQATADATLVDERDMLRRLLARIIKDHDPVDSEEYHGETRWVCDYCFETTPVEQHAAPDWLPLNHAPDCPWRQAAEYIARLEVAE